ncbi:hypothetical protein [Bradyrhizobium sp. SZCCHNRI1073]|uniref:hypothetical protein n=1 Tax=Bradyrhizobium sp. SZCCHNRI1073 TaxID=3057280 RepID=UPI00291661D6|nr:hypothetical protein [Bradyrhizobium sp. SZCCHNRI1073]
MINSIVPISAAGQLGLGSALQNQVKDETEEEKKRRQMGLSQLQGTAAQMLLGNPFGPTGVGQV